MRFKEIEYVNQKDGTRKRWPVASLEVRGIVPVIPGPDSYPKWHTGICVAINMPVRDKEQDQDLFDEMWGMEENWPFTVWLIGEDDVKIPLQSAEGHPIWRFKSKTSKTEVPVEDGGPGLSTIFGYMNPTFFEEPQPEK